MQQATVSRDEQKAGVELRKSEESPREGERDRDEGGLILGRPVEDRSFEVVETTVGLAAGLAIGTAVAGPVGAVVGAVIGAAAGLAGGEAVERAAGRAATTTDAE